jgi:predicted TIM-barrel fold metal-dependent hydrolase
MTASAQPTAAKPESEVLISVDSQVAEPTELWDRLPGGLRAQRPALETLPDGGERYTIEGSTSSLPLQERLTEDDWVLEAFAPEPQRFRPAAMIPTDDATATFDEAERCLQKGFKTLFLPITVPWLPCWHPSGEPLWSLAGEADIPLSFHVFSGNVWFGTEFAFLRFLSPERFETARKMYREAGDVREHYSSTVVGMAAGMSPIIDLTGAGILERHPGLRFAIIDDPVGLHNIPLTASDCLLWGNDYPHDEGTFPNSRKTIESMREVVDPEPLAKILGENAARLYDFDLDYLAGPEIPASA